MQVVFTAARWGPFLASCESSDLVTALALALAAQPGQESIEFRTADLVAATGLTRQTLQRCLRTLERQGVLAVHQCKAHYNGTTIIELSPKWIKVKR